jgi:hypothetical protein
MTHIINKFNIPKEEFLSTVVSQRQNIVSQKQNVVSQKQNVVSQRQNITMRLASIFDLNTKNQSTNDCILQTAWKQDPSIRWDLDTTNLSNPISYHPPKCISIDDVLCQRISCNDIDIDKSFVYDIDIQPCQLVRQIAMSNEDLEELKDYTMLVRLHLDQPKVKLNDLFHQLALESQDQSKQSDYWKELVLRNNLIRPLDQLIVDDIDKLIVDDIDIQPCKLVRQIAMSNEDIEELKDSNRMYDMIKTSQVKDPELNLDDLLHRLSFESQVKEPDYWKDIHTCQDSLYELFGTDELESLSDIKKIQLDENITDLPRLVRQNAASSKDMEYINKVLGLI